MQTREDAVCMHGLDNGLEVQPCGPTVVKVSTLFCCIRDVQVVSPGLLGGNGLELTTFRFPLGASSRSPTARRPRVDAAKFALCIA